MEDQTIQTQTIQEEQFSKETQRLLKGLRILQDRLETKDNAQTNNVEVENEKGD